MIDVFVSRLEKCRSQFAWIVDPKTNALRAFTSANDGNGTIEFCPVGAVLFHEKGIVARPEDAWEFSEDVGLEYGDAMTVIAASDSFHVPGLGEPYPNQAMVRNRMLEAVGLRKSA